MKPAQRNFIAGVASEFFWGMGFALFLPQILVSRALVELGGSATLVGLLASIFSIGLTLPQVFSALTLPPRFTDPPRLVGLHLPALLGPLVAGLAFLVVPAKYPGYTVVVVLAGFAMFSMGIGIVIPHWVGCVGRCIPEKVRGRYFGVAFFGSGLGATLTGWLGERWADEGGLAWGYSLSFLSAILFMFLSLGCMLFFKPLVGRPKPQRPGAVWRAFRMMNEKLLEPGPFRVGLVLVILLNLASAPGNLFTVYLLQTVKMKGAWLQFLTPAMTLGAMAGSFLLGWTTDHRGLRAAYGVAFLAGLASLALIILGGNPITPALAFAGFGFLNAAFPVVTLVMLLKFGGRHESTLQQGLFNTLMSPWSFLAPIAAGWLAGWLGYGWTFAGGGTCCLVALLILDRYKGLEGKKAPFKTRKRQS
ncbi:MAG TPA: MFS transporter [bacterium]|nr:MFS transporter [bacterium]